MDSTAIQLPLRRSPSHVYTRCAFSCLLAQPKEGYSAHHYGTRTRGEEKLLQSNLHRVGAVLFELWGGVWGLGFGVWDLEWGLTGVLGSILGLEFGVWFGARYNVWA